MTQNGGRTNGLQSHLIDICHKKTPGIGGSAQEGTSNSCNKMTTAERAITIHLYVPWDAESSERLYAACRTQDACWNLALEFLMERPDEPLRKSKGLGIKGLQGRWLEWREEHEWAKNVPQATLRGGVLRAKEQMERWEEVNEAHMKACLKAREDGKDIPPPGTTPVPRPDEALPATQGPRPAAAQHLPSDRRGKAHRCSRPPHSRGRKGARARAHGRGL